MSQVVAEIELSKLVPSKFNVRRDVGDITELAFSIKEHGVLEPIVVRPVGDKYEVVVGSRRVAAAKQVGLKTIPAIVRKMDDTEAMITSLVENLQRGDLSIREEGEAYTALKLRLGSIREIERQTGISKQRISDSLEAYQALLKLETSDIKVSVRLPDTSMERQTSKAIPKEHAIELERAFKVVDLPEEEKIQKYVEMAKAIAPLEQSQAKRVLDYFKMYPEKPVQEIVEKALSKVTLETYITPVIARTIDQIAETKGKRLEEVVAEVIEKGLEVTRKEEKIERKEVTIELPEEPISVQLLNKRMWNIKRANLKTYDFYTIGYSEIPTIDDFISLLKEAGVKTLIDVRHDPVSPYRPEFNRDNLVKVIRSNGMEYYHIPDLGVPKEIRQRLAETGDWNSFFEWYDINVLPKLDKKIKLDKFVKPIAFMCVELDPTKCHRHRIAKALEAKGWKSMDL